MSHLKEALDRAELTVALVHEDSFLDVDECFAECYVACQPGGFIGDQIL